MSNNQFSKAVESFKTYSLTTANFFSSCRRQGMTRKDYETWSVQELCAMSDVIKEYAFKKDGSVKTVSAVWKNFTPAKNKADRGTLDWSIAFANSSMVGYSNYLKANGLDPKTCKAAPVLLYPVLEAVVNEAAVNEAAVNEAAVNEAAVNEATVNEAAVNEAAVNELTSLKEQVMGKEEHFLTVQKAVLAIISGVNEKKTKAQLLEAINEIEKIVNC